MGSSAVCSPNFFVRRGNRQSLKFSGDRQNINRHRQVIWRRMLAAAGQSGLCYQCGEKRRQREQNSFMISNKQVDLWSEPLPHLESHRLIDHLACFDVFSLYSKVIGEARLGCFHGSHNVIRHRAAVGIPVDKIRSKRECQDRCINTMPAIKRGKFPWVTTLW